MDFLKEILRDNSKQQALQVAGWIGSNEDRFLELLQIFLHGDYREVQLSASSLGTYYDIHPEIVRKKIPQLVKRLNDEGTHIAVRRNILRILQCEKIPKRLHACVLNKCFEYLQDPNETIAIRCFAMTILVNLAKVYPEIRNEVYGSIEISMKNSSAGLKARSKMVLKELEKLNQKL